MGRARAAYSEAWPDSTSRQDPQQVLWYLARASLDLYFTQCTKGGCMKRVYLILCLLSLSAWLGYSQTTPKRSADEELQKLTLLSDVKALAIEVPKLDGPLARALADAEIANAAWTLDRDWAKKTLREAYHLTYPSAEDQSKIGPELPGAAPRPPTAIGRARSEVRRRVLSVARRDKAFADQLILESARHVTKDDRQMTYAQLARMALDEGDNDAATRSIQDSMQVDPTQIVFVELVNDLALKDRAAADKLIIECLTNLSKMQLSEQNLSIGRADMVLRWLIFPNSFFPDPNKQIPPPGPQAMKAYVSYVLETMTVQEQKEPGSLKRARSLLLSVWLPLNKYAPELKDRFLQLEALSRAPGSDASLPTQSYEELDKERFRKRDSEALNSNQPNDQSIASAITRGEFDTARKLIEKLPDGEKKSAFTEQANAKESVSLAQKGELASATSLAERLTRLNSMLEVYPLIVQGYAKEKNPASAAATVQQAMRQLKKADTKPANTPFFGMPASFAPTSAEVDPLLSGLGKLAQAILPVDSLLASDVVDEMVERANASPIDTTQGRTGIDGDIFSKLAARDEIRARTAAEAFKDRLRRIVAIAAIYQWKAKVLDKGVQDKAARN